jgi:hypothetical protein
MNEMKGRGIQPALRMKGAYAVSGGMTAVVGLKCV